MQATAAGHRVHRLLTSDLTLTTNPSILHPICVLHPVRYSQFQSACPGRQELEAEGHVSATEAAQQGRQASEAAFAAYAIGHLAMAAALSDVDALAAAGAALRKRRRALASQADCVSCCLHLLEKRQAELIPAHDLGDFGAYTSCNCTSRKCAVASSA